MATEEYSVGYDAGYQAGWNEAMDAQTKPPQRKPLTPQQFNHMAELFVIPPHHVEMIVRTIEAFHGIKE